MKKFAWLILALLTAGSKVTAAPTVSIISVSTNSLQNGATVSVSLGRIDNLNTNTLRATNAIVTNLTTVNYIAQSTFSAILTTGTIQAGTLSVSQDPPPFLSVSAPITFSNMDFSNTVETSQINPGNANSKYSSFDARPLAESNFDYEQISSFQDRTRFFGGGILNNQWGFISIPNISSGTTNTRAGVYIKDPQGTGTIANNTGILIDELTRGTTDNFAIHTKGDTTSQLDGSLQIGSIPSTQHPMPSFLMSKSITGHFINFDNIRDLSVITPLEDGSLYASWDTSAIANGPFNYGHISGYQDRLFFNSTGTLDQQFSYYSQPTYSTGTVHQRLAVRVRDALGTGTLWDNEGIYVEELTRGSTNYAVHTVGGTKSLFEGPVTVQGQLIGKGTTTNDNAASTDIGYSSSCVVSSPVDAAASGSYQDLCSITVGPGDFWMDLLTDFAPNGATVTQTRAGFSPNPGDDGTGMIFGDTVICGVVPTAVTDGSVSIPPRRISLSSPTTYYLKILANYSVATPQERGRLSAWRAR